jgi:hypothetical protein
MIGFLLHWSRSEIYGAGKWGTKINRSCKELRKDQRPTNVTISQQTKGFQGGGLGARASPSEFIGLSQKVNRAGTLPRV